MTILGEEKPSPLITRMEPETPSIVVGAGPIYIPPSYIYIYMYVCSEYGYPYNVLTTIYI